MRNDKLKGEMYNSTLQLEFNILLSRNGITTRQKISKDIEPLNSIINPLDQILIYGIYMEHSTLQKTEHICFVQEHSLL